ncbi:hypothetical protein KPH14_012680, partial [Odynerus spinipes]
MSTAATTRICFGCAKQIVHDAVRCPTCTALFHPSCKSRRACCAAPKARRAHQPDTPRLTQSTARSSMKTPAAGGASCSSISSCSASAEQLDRMPLYSADTQATATATPSSF